MESFRSASNLLASGLDVLFADFGILPHSVSEKNNMSYNQSTMYHYALKTKRDHSLIHYDRNAEIIDKKTQTIKTIQLHILKLGSCLNWMTYFQFPLPVDEIPLPRHIMIIMHTNTHKSLYIYSHIHINWLRPSLNSLKHNRIKIRNVINEMRH